MNKISNIFIIVVIMGMLLNIFSLNTVIAEDPLLDTDGDGLFDINEIELGFNPFDPQDKVIDSTEIIPNEGTINVCNWEVDYKITADDGLQVDACYYWRNGGTTGGTKYGVLLGEIPWVSIDGVKHQLTSNKVYDGPKINYQADYFSLTVLYSPIGDWDNYFDVDWIFYQNGDVLGQVTVWFGTGHGALPVMVEIEIDISSKIELNPDKNYMHRDSHKWYGGAPARWQDITQERMTSRVEPYDPINPTRLGFQYPTKVRAIDDLYSKQLYFGPSQLLWGTGANTNRYYHLAGHHWGDDDYPWDCENGEDIYNEWNENTWEDENGYTVYFGKSSVGTSGVVYDNFMMFRSYPLSQQGTGIGNPLTPLDDITKCVVIENPMNSYSIEYSLCLRNDIDITDTIDLEITSVSTGWDAELSDYSYDLIPGGQEDISLIVTTPLDPQINEPAYVTVEATSRFDSEISNAITITAIPIL